MEYLEFKIKKIIFLIFILFSTFYVLRTPVFAQEKPIQMLRISPAILNISLSPGKTYNYEITATNLLDTPLPLRVAAEDFDTEGEDGGYIFPNTANSPIINWLTIDKKDLLIPPHSDEKIQLTLALPQVIPFGGYYATIFFEPVLSNLSNSSMVQSRIGALLLANVGSSDLEQVKAQILNFSFDRLFYEKGPISADFRVKNLSLHHFSAKPILYVKQLLGKEQRLFIEERLLFPGKTRHWNIPILFDKWGIFQAHLVIALGGGKQITQTAYFVMFPYKEILLVILFVTITIFILKKRKQLKKALKTLFGMN